MSYEEFLEEICQMVAAKVEKGTKVTISSVLKNNQNRVDSMSIHQAGENLSPAINLNAYYEQYRRGISMDMIVKQILAYYYIEKKKGSFDISCYTDFEQVKSSIACKLVSYEKNQYILAKVPYRRFLDLAIVYYYKMEHPALGKASILIQHTHLELWNTDLEELQRLADENTLRLLPWQFLEIEELVEQVTGREIDFGIPNPLKLYVLTNQEQFFGAVNMIFDSVLEGIYEKLGEEFYVLPSSIHECMVLPVSAAVSTEYLQTMVREVNEACVDPSEVLGDSVYRYDCCGKKLWIASVKNR